MIALLLVAAVAPPLPAEQWEAFFSAPGSYAVSERTFGVVLPHHFVAGEEITRAYRGLASKRRPSLIVVLSPNHFDKGAEAVVTSGRALELFDGEALPIDRTLVEALQATGLVGVDDSVFAGEHGISLHAQYVARFFPGALVLPLAVKNGASAAHLDRVAAELARLIDPANALVVMSLDASHYNPELVADFHDQQTIAALLALDLDTDPLEIDSNAALRVFLGLMRREGAMATEILAHQNSQRFLQARVNETTSHVLAAFAIGEPVKTAKRVSLQFFGDGFFGRGLAADLREVPKPTSPCPAPLSPFYAVMRDVEAAEKRFFRGTDCNVLNLEGPLAGNDGTQPHDFVLTQPDAVPALLRSYGFCAAGIANNHTFDHYRSGVERTKRALLAEGVLPVAGCQRLERRGVKIALCAFDDVRGVLARDDAVAQVRAARADVTVVNVHWGHELERVPSAQQTSLARLFVDAGADLIIGHHPHIVQPAEIYRGKAIFYSLGNFAFDYAHRGEWEGLSVGAAFADDVVSLYLFPLGMTKGRPRPANEAERKTILARVGLGSDRLVLTPARHATTGNRPE